MRGIVTVMDTRTLEIIRTKPIDLRSRENGRTSAILSADGNTLYVGVGGSSVSRVDVATLDVLEDWPLPGDVTGLALSEDGARLYAAIGDSVAIVDTGTGDASATRSFGPVESILHVATP